MIINDMVRTGLALLLILGASAAKRHSLRVMDDILLEEDASFWGRDLQMSMPTPPSDEFGSKYVSSFCLVVFCVVYTMAEARSTTTRTL